MAITTDSSVIKMTAVGDSLSGMGFHRVRVKLISWRGMSSGHTCVLNQGAGGQELFSSVATSDNDNDEQLIDGWLSDVYVTTLGGGSVYIHLD